MEYFKVKTTGNVLVVRLDPGDFVLESLWELVRNEGLNNAVVISGIGTLDKCVLHMVTTTGYPPKEYYRKWDGEPLELVSLSGIIADGEPHLHAVVSDTEKAYAGHLEKGCRVLYLAEIVVAEFEASGLTRAADERGIRRLKRKQLQ